MNVQGSLKRNVLHSTLPYPARGIWLRNGCFHCSDRDSDSDAGPSSAATSTSEQNSVNACRAVDLTLCLAQLFTCTLHPCPRSLPLCLPLPPCRLFHQAESYIVKRTGTRWLFVKQTPHEEQPPHDILKPRSLGPCSEKNRKSQTSAQGRETF